MLFSRTADYRKTARARCSRSARRPRGASALSSRRRHGPPLRSADFIVFRLFLWLMVIGSFHRWLLQLPARWRGRARLPRGQLRRETVSWLHYTGVQAVGVLFYPSTTAALSSKEKHIWVNRTSYNRSRALAPVGQHRCQGSPWPAPAQGCWLPGGGLPILPARAKGHWLPGGGLTILPARAKW